MVRIPNIYLCRLIIELNIFNITKSNCLDNIFRNIKNKIEIKKHQ